ncbi:MAG TPA: ParA family protein, partial [Acidimicrobiales bacterium]|nr:ParA family protein [Acidimicrobiales bacterium]
QKGGTGKTTAVRTLTDVFRKVGLATLAVDLDPQGNLSDYLDVDPDAAPTVGDVLSGRAKAAAAVHDGIIPANLGLAEAELMLGGKMGRELTLKKALREVKGDYDIVLIDCPPSLGLITINGLAAASEVLVPIQCEYYALEGLGQLLRNVHLVQANLNEKLEVSTIVLTMYDGRTKLAEQVADEVRSHFGNKVCRNIIPRTVRISEAPSFGQPITVFDPSSRGAIAYRELAKEVSGGKA